MQQIQVIVRNKVGLHARPAAQFVKTAVRFTSRITIKNNSRCSDILNAKSILSVLSAGVQVDDAICITAEGDDEAAALQALSELVESNFGEPGQA